MAIFTLPFVGKNFFRGFVANDDLAFGKDATYELIKGFQSNWFSCKHIQLGKVEIHH